MKYDPSLYQKQGTPLGFANIHFGKAGWDRGDGIQFDSVYLGELLRGKTLFILSQKELFAQEGMVASRKVTYSLRVLQAINGVYTKAPFFAVEVY
jgi:hypothetical protein